MATKSKRQQVKDLEKNYTEANGDETLKKIQSLERTMYDELVPMVDLNEVNKQTVLSLIISREMDVIEKRCRDWYKETFTEKRIVPQQVYDRNFNDDLEYMFSRGLWLLNITVSLGYIDEHINEHFAKLFVLYDEKGHKELVGYFVHEYNVKENRPFTAKELATRKKRQSKIMKEIIARIK